MIARNVAFDAYIEACKEEGELLKKKLKQKYEKKLKREFPAVI